MPDDFERHWMSAENAVSFIMLYFSAQNNVRLIYTPFSQPGEMPRTGQEEHRARAWIVTLNRTADRLCFRVGKHLDKSEFAV